jgi:hypothetical protein
MRVPHALLVFTTAATAAATGAIASTPGCVRQGGPVVAAVETAEIGDAGVGTPLDVAPSRPGRDQCTARLRPMPIKTNDGCTLDERLSKNTGVLLYPCSGAGELEAVFGEHHFRGTLADGKVQLALTTELDWDDGCHWETQQSINGELRREGSASTKLIWSYDERPLQGTSCFGSCKARAEIEVDELAH